MKITFHIPLEDSRPGEFQTLPAITEMVQALDRAGVDACWMAEHPAPAAKWLEEGGHHTLDPFVAFAFIAAASPRIKLYTNIVVLAYRNPFLTAKMAATLDVLSGGRLILGVGLGYMKAEFAALGVDFTQRAALMDEAIVTMKKAWTGEAVTAKGLHFDAEGNISLPRPAQRPHPPIWAGGNSEKAMRRAVAHCDGWAPFPASPALSAVTGTDELADIAGLKAKLGLMKDLCAEMGRTRPLDICMVPFGGAVRMKDRHTAGLPDLAALSDQIEALAEIGVTWVALSAPCPSRAAYIDHVARFGEELIQPIKRRALG